MRAVDIEEKKAEFKMLKELEKTAQKISSHQIPREKRYLISVSSHTRLQSIQSGEIKSVDEVENKDQEYEDIDQYITRSIVGTQIMFR